MTRLAGWEAITVTVLIHSIPWWRIRMDCCLTSLLQVLVLFSFHNSKWCAFPTWASSLTSFPRQFSDTKKDSVCGSYLVSYATPCSPYLPDSLKRARASFVWQPMVQFGFICKLYHADSELASQAQINRRVAVLKQSLVTWKPQDDQGNNPGCMA